MSKEKLTVQPLKKYKNPKYPSYEDSNPLEEGLKDPSKASFYTAALLGAVGLFSFSEGKAQTDTTGNPIKFENLGFPHYYASYGTGLPSRMPSEDAIAIIDSVFKANDLQLDTNVAINHKGSKFIADGYSEELKLGFVFINSNNGSEELFRSWRRSITRGYLLPEDQKLVDDIDKKYKDSDDWQMLQEEREALYKKLIAKNNFYKLRHIQSVNWSDRDLNNRIEKYIEKNKNYEDPDYGQELVDEYNDLRISWEEIDRMMEDDDVSMFMASYYSNDNAYRAWGDELGKDRATVEKKLAELVQDYINWGRAEGRF